MDTNKSARWPTRRVLVVDDEPFILEVVEMYLKEAGFAAGSAACGEEALQTFKESHWDLIVTDRAMPGMDGEVLAERVRDIAPGFPIILITGFAKPGLHLELFDDVLLKPFSKDQLIAAVERSLAKSPIQVAA